MNRLELLELLLERERRRRDEAIAQWRTAQRNLDAARSQFDGLTTYRTEYCRRWSGQFARSVTIDIMRCYQGFVERLEQAIGQQGGAVRMAETGLETARRRMVEREVKVATVERLIQRRADHLARAAERRETKTLDELSQRRSPALRPEDRGAA